MNVRDECALARFCWCVVREVMAWPTLPSCPDDIENFCRNKSNKHSKRVLFLFSGVAWSLWLIRMSLSSESCGSFT
jgi:hypothetical protein